MTDFPEMHAVPRDWLPNPEYLRNRSSEDTEREAVAEQHRANTMRTHGTAGSWNEDWQWEPGDNLWTFSGTYSRPIYQILRDEVTATEYMLNGMGRWWGGMVCTHCEVGWHYQGEGDERCWVCGVDPRKRAEAADTGACLAVQPQGRVTTPDQGTQADSAALGGALYQHMSQAEWRAQHGLAEDPVWQWREERGLEEAVDDGD